MRIVPIRSGSTLLVCTTICFAGVLAGCDSSNGATKLTCDEYAVKDFDARGDVIQDLLKAHDLEPLGMGNNMGLTAALEDFCGFSPLNYKNGSAAKNGSRKIDGAVDWELVKTSGKWPE